MPNETGTTISFGLNDRPPVATAAFVAMILEVLIPRHTTREFLVHSRLKSLLQAATPIESGRPWKLLLAGCSLPAVLRA